jgi:hypothetical protein
MLVHARIAACGRCTAPAAGLVRLVLTWAVGYQHPVGEYGVHWNFFFTLAAVKLMSTAVPLEGAAALRRGRCHHDTRQNWSCRIVFDVRGHAQRLVTAQHGCQPARSCWSRSMPRYSFDRSIWCAGVGVAVVHQLLLSWGLIDVVHSGARGPGLASLNKEGLLSLPVSWCRAQIPSCTNHMPVLSCGWELSAPNERTAHARPCAAVQGYWALHLLSAGCGHLITLSRIQAVDTPLQRLHAKAPVRTLWRPHFKCGDSAAACLVNEVASCQPCLVVRQE